MLFYLKAANSDVDLTAALVWTVEHLEHPICFDDGTSPVSLRPDAAKTHAVDSTRGQQEEQISAVQPRPYTLLNVSEWDPNSPCRVVSAHLLRLRCSSRSLPSSRASTLGCSSCLSLKPAEKRCENWLQKRLVQVLAESIMSTFHILRMGTYHTSEAWKGTRLRGDNMHYSLGFKMPLFVSLLEAWVIVVWLCLMHTFHISELNRNN